MTMIALIIAAVVFLSFSFNTGYSRYDYHRRPPVQTTFYTENDDWQYHRYRSEQNARALQFTVLFVFVLFLWLKYNDDNADKEALKNSKDQPSVFVRP
jgi:hypothetical protein